MKQTLKENGGLPASILWTLSIVAGITVANLYYNQPLLNMIRQDLHVSEVITNLIAMVTQIGYAMGLLFVIPLGDMFQRKKIIIINFSILIISLLSIALAPSIHIVLTASLFTGICSVMPQIFIPIAALYSKPEQRAECRAGCLRPVNRNTGLAGNQRNRRRNIRMAGDVLYCNRLDGCLCHRHNTGITGNTTDI